MNKLFNFSLLFSCLWLGQSVPYTVLVVETIPPFSRFSETFAVNVTLPFEYVPPRITDDLSNPPSTYLPLPIYGEDHDTSLLNSGAEEEENLGSEEARVPKNGSSEFEVLPESNTVTPLPDSITTDVAPPDNMIEVVPPLESVMADSVEAFGDESKK